MLNTVYPFLFAIALAMLSAAAHPTPPDSRDIAVAIRRDADAIDVDVDLRVEATPQQVWDVLTDYGHMAEFVSNVAMSRIVRRAEEKLEVAQTSRLTFGPFEFTFDNVREIEFVPLQEIRSKVVSGDMKASAFTTRLAAEGGETRITNRGRFIPGRWIPPLIGTAVLETETRKQFAEVPGRDSCGGRVSVRRGDSSVMASYFWPILLKNSKMHPLLVLAKVNRDRQFAL